MTIATPQSVTGRQVVSGEPSKSDNKLQETISDPKQHHTTQLATSAEKEKRMKRLWKAQRRTAAYRQQQCLDSKPATSSLNELENDRMTYSGPEHKEGKEDGQQMKNIEKKISASADQRLKECFDLLSSSLPNIIAQARDEEKENQNRHMMKVREVHENQLRALRLEETSKLMRLRDVFASHQTQFFAKLNNLDALSKSLEHKIRAEHQQYDESLQKLRLTLEDSTIEFQQKLAEKDKLLKDKDQEIFVLLAMTRELSRHVKELQEAAPPTREIKQNDATFSAITEMSDTNKIYCDPASDCSNDIYSTFGKKTTDASVCVTASQNLKTPTRLSCECDLTEIETQTQTPPTVPRGQDKDNIGCNECLPQVKKLNLSTGESSLKATIDFLITKCTENPDAFMLPQNICELLEGLEFISPMTDVTRKVLSTSDKGTTMSQDPPPGLIMLDKGIDTSFSSLTLGVSIFADSGHYLDSESASSSSNLRIKPEQPSLTMDSSQKRSSNSLSKDGQLSTQTSSNSYNNKAAGHRSQMKAEMEHEIEERLLWQDYPLAFRVQTNHEKLNGAIFTLKLSTNMQNPFGDSCEEEDPTNIVYRSDFGMMFRDTSTEDLKWCIVPHPASESDFESNGSADLEELCLRYKSQSKYFFVTDTFDDKNPLNCTTWKLYIQDGSGSSTYAAAKVQIAFNENQQASKECLEGYMTQHLVSDICFRKYQLSPWVYASFPTSKLEGLYFEFSRHHGCHGIPLPKIVELRDPKPIFDFFTQEARFKRGASLNDDQRFKRDLADIIGNFLSSLSKQQMNEMLDSLARSTKCKLQAVARRSAADNSDSD